jgi:REP element-mobilizing transposase RayT
MAMKYNPEIHHRRSIRLKEYDYSNAGAYFVTMCTWQKECLFGDVMNGEMRLNELGGIVDKEWVQTAVVRSNVELDVYIVMPNHFHGIIILNDPVGATRRVAHDMTIDDMANNTRATHRVAPTTLQSGSIGAILGQFKSIAAKTINQTRNTLGMPLWQRNYFERVIRNENELHAIRQYIINNPLQWDMDENNPVNL